MDSMDAVEYAHWQALYRIDPWGGYRQDLAAATVAATVANVHRGRDAEAWGLDDFLAFDPYPHDVEPDHDAISAGVDAYFRRLRAVKGGET